MPLPNDGGILGVLADRYRRSRAGRTGQAVRDLVIDYEELLKEADCSTGDSRVCAERELADAERAGVITIDRHRRDPKLLVSVRFSPENEAKLFNRIGQSSPSDRRAALATLFREAAGVMAEQWSEAWTSFCLDYAKRAEGSLSLPPFDARNQEEVAELLQLLPRILTWKGESHLRFASCLLCGDSKRMEALQAKLNSCLAIVTRGELATLSDVGIIPNERSLLLSGPIALSIGAETVNLGPLSGPFRLDRRDIERASLQTTAERCLTVENGAMLNELAKVRSGTLLASSGSEGGFAHSAIIVFLKKLPERVECWHFGDADPAGFSILADLRKRTGREIRSLHMRYRTGGGALSSSERVQLTQLATSTFLTAAEKGEIEAMLRDGSKGRYEQEFLGVPAPTWPFYE